MGDLIYTCVAGLAWQRGFIELVHVASGEVVLRLPAGRDAFTRAELTADIRNWFLNPVRHTSVLHPMMYLKWTGPLEEAHRELLERLAIKYQTVDGVRAEMERMGRVMRGLERIISVMNGERGKKVTAALTALETARGARRDARSGPEKAQATRLEKVAQKALLEAGFTEAQMDAYTAPHRAQAYFKGMTAMQAEQKRLWAEYEQRTDTGQQVALKYLCRSQAAVVTDLQVCLMMFGRFSPTLAAYGRPPKPYGQTEPTTSFLKSANTERVRRLKARESLNPADPEVRKLTRQTRISQGERRADSSEVPAIKNLKALKRAFYAASQFKGKNVRKKHYVSALSELESQYACPTQRRAVLRVMHAHLAKECSYYGRVPFAPAELPAAPRWQRPTPACQPILLSAV